MDHNWLNFLDKEITLPKRKPVKIMAKPPGCLRVATFNVHFGKKVLAIAEALRYNPNLAQADIILFQEIEHHAKEIVSRAAKIARVLGMEHSYVPARKLQLKNGTHGIAILSRQPLRGAQTISLPYYINFPLRHKPRIALRVEINFVGKAVSIYNIHLDTTLNSRERLAQLQTVMNDIYLQAGKSAIILGGDFNTAPLFFLGRMIPVFYSNQKKKLRTYLKSVGFDTRCQTVGRTMRQGGMYFQLDGIYTKTAPVVQFAVEKSVRVSDHFPLWADIKIP